MLLLHLFVSNDYYTLYIIDLNIVKYYYLNINFQNEMYMWNEKQLYYSIRKKIEKIYI